MASWSACARNAAGVLSPRFRAVLLCAQVAACSGCYAYVPVEFSAVQSGQLVRADISPSGQQNLVPHFGPGVAELRGMTLSADADSLALLVEGVSGRQGMIPTEVQTVRLVVPDVSQLYERRLARGRSLLFGAGVLAVAFLLVDSFADLGRVFRGEDVDPPPPPQARPSPGWSPSGAFAPGGSGRDR